ncbi:AAA family ATPase [Corynebacterium stationis]|uniref:AAA family ATPase n=1 Tax=Corynebacterium stationis TaxID=1705 RepID=A0AB36CIX3_9CORY|nr:AAA family ATPase [Corynebacterium stationis]NME88387.1 AAA family ATPase [Corynebacterium stationis]
MFSNLKIESDFRSLNSKTFDGSLRFGKRTIIYGHNGSGKSSIAELFHQLSKGTQTTPIHWYNEEQKSQKILPSNIPSEMVISSFCKSWIQENVSEFLEGSSAASIVTLGKAAQDAKTEEETLYKSVKRLAEKVPDAQKTSAEAKQAVDIVVNTLQSAIESTLRDVDHREYTKNKYTRRKVRDLLLKSQQSFPTEAEHKRNLGILKQAKLEPVEFTKYPSFDWDDFVQEVKALLSRDIQSEIIGELVGNAPLQDWLQKGLDLHKGTETCNFCLNLIPSDRLNQLQRHFDESRTKVKNQATNLRNSIADHLDSISIWWDEIPESSRLYPELAKELQQAVTDESEFDRQYRDKFTDIDQLLFAKFEAPERTDITVTTTSPPITPGEQLQTVIDKHNELAGKDKERKLEVAKYVLAYLVGEQSEEFSKLDAVQTTRENELTDLKVELDKEQKLLQEAKAKQFSSAEMAAQISKDLEFVYGKNHLKVKVSQDGKHYQCTRGSLPAKNLSEGERNSLALLYFLRRLEDESQGVSPDQRLIIIDDPSSSLDRESVFATHSWLLRSLQTYKQSIILTHDFELLRLFLNSQKSQLNEDRKDIRQGSRKDATAQEKRKKEKAERAPRIAFLEILARTNEDGTRNSRLQALSETFLKFHSEYHFLFDRLLTGIENTDNHELIFLLPNAARRVLESFVSFHVPGSNGFEQQLKKVALDDCNEEYRDVYDFCNRFSHGEGREHQLLLDATTVFLRIRRSLELIKTTDYRHYKAMCRAVNRSEKEPLSGLSWNELEKQEVNIP